MLGHCLLFKLLLFINFNKGLIIKMSKTLEEACEFLLAGFEFVFERDGVNVFRKRK